MISNGGLKRIIGNNPRNLYNGSFGDFPLFCSVDVRPMRPSRLVPAAEPHTTSRAEVKKLRDKMTNK